MQTFMWDEFSNILYSHVNLSCHVVAFSVNLGGRGGRRRGGKEKGEGRRGRGEKRGRGRVKGRGRKSRLDTKLSLIVPVLQAFSNSLAYAT